MKIDFFFTQALVKNEHTQVTDTLAINCTKDGPSFQITNNKPILSDGHQMAIAQVAKRLQVSC